MREVLKIPSGHDGLIFEFRAAEHPIPMQRAHRHEELELNLVTSGRAAYQLERQRYALRPGSLVWLFPDQEHRLIDRSGDFAMHVAVFREPLLRRLAKEDDGILALGRRDPGEDFCRAVSLETTDHLDAVCRRIELDGDGRGGGGVDGVNSETLRFAGQAYGSPVNEIFRHPSPGALNRGLAYLLGEAWKAFETEGRDDGGVELHPAVARAVALLADAGGEALDWRLEDLAQRCGLSASRLSRLFGRQIGISLASFRQQKRLDRFVRLWSDGGAARGMSACCYEAGFGSYAQFHKVFSKRFGAGPRAILRG